MTEELRALIACASLLEEKLRALQPDSNFGCWRASAVPSTMRVCVIHYVGRVIHDVPTASGFTSIAPPVRQWFLTISEAVLYLGWLTTSQGGSPADCVALMAGGAWGPPAPIGVVER